MTDTDPLHLLLEGWVLLLPNVAIRWKGKEQKTFPNTFSKRELIFC